MSDCINFYCVVGYFAVSTIWYLGFSVFQQEKVINALGFKWVNTVVTFQTLV